MWASHARGRQISRLFGGLFYTILVVVAGGPVNYSTRGWLRDSGSQAARMVQLEENP
jgi:hypothetical protein